MDIAIKSAREYGFLRIIPSTDLDSLIAASVLSKNLEEHNIVSTINTDPRIIVENLDEPLLLINLPRVFEKRNVYELKYSGECSTTGYITHYLDRIWGVSKWDKILSIIAGMYRGLDRGREGFKYIEKEILDELAKSGYVSVDLGLKLWGWKHNSLLKSIYRTLIPFLPGYSGDPHRTFNFLKTIIGLSNVENIRGEQVVTFEESKLDKTRSFIEKLTQSFEVIDQESRNKLIFKLVGYIYTIRIETYIYDILECYGSLELLANIDFENITYLTLISHDSTIISQSLIIYNNLIDEVSIDISVSMRDYLRKNTNIVEINSSVKRPDIYIDIIESIDKLPVNKPLIVKNNDLLYTSLREYIRVNRDLEKAYSRCSEYQICVVDEHGNLLET